MRRWRLGPRPVLIRIRGSERGRERREEGGGKRKGGATEGDRLSLISLACFLERDLYGGGNGGLNIPLHNLFV